MNVYYPISEKTKLKTFLWSDLLENDAWRTHIEVTPVHNGKEGRACKKEVLKDSNGTYIIWNGQNIYLNDFGYTPTEVLIKNLTEGINRKDRWFVSDDEIYATLMKDTENVGVIIDMAAYDAIYPDIGIGLVGQNYHTVLCIPTEKQYNKNRWNYKITLECKDESLRKIIPSRHFYFEDFCSLLKNGHATLVDIKEIKQKMI